ncbi:TadE/TadG family type IV pilus assembly protein [Roseivivax sediminis]|uniref:TadE-like protein n=1 Tax=Roseivivax sediminis TaxID=936889 RepID=A0A1I1SNQ2_9RHOB|nr:pilus assembly protein [Roseivivax sediminis]SFD45523.1 hypothetical protein SAMN04515678_101154 [Roseivivax sediminis]
MTRVHTAYLRRFARNEDGAVQTVPYVLWILIFIVFILGGVEMGMYTARQTMLEHGLDKTIRRVRLGTGTIYDRETLKEMICDNSVILPYCEDELYLEMVKLDIRDWQLPPQNVKCYDDTVDATGSGSDGYGGSDDEVQPQVAFEYGRENELMMLRACFRFEPITPTLGLGKYLASYYEDDGHARMNAVGAFVHEPL